MKLGIAILGLLLIVVATTGMLAAQSADCAYLHTSSDQRPYGPCLEEPDFSGATFRVVTTEAPVCQQYLALDGFEVPSTHQAAAEREAEHGGGRYRPGDRVTVSILTAREPDGAVTSVLLGGIIYRPAVREGNSSYGGSWESPTYYGLFYNSSSDRWENAAWVQLSSMQGARSGYPDQIKALEGLSIVNPMIWYEINGVLSHNDLPDGNSWRGVWHVPIRVDDSARISEVKAALKECQSGGDDTLSAREQRLAELTAAMARLMQLLTEIYLDMGR